MTTPIAVLTGPSLRRVYGRFDLPKAIEDQRFGFLLQPQYRLGDLKLCGFEALARLHVASGQWTAPEHFLPLTHAAGIMRALTLQMIEHACRTLQHWRGGRLAGVFIAVNIEVEDLHDVRFAPRVCQLLARYRIQAGELELELAEGRPLRLGDTADNSFRLLREAGVGWAMDHFGTGRSTLSRLAEMPFDTVKTDKTFLGRIPQDTQAGILMAGVIDMCLALQKCVVVEGVETEAQRQWLARPAWVDVRVQGNGLSLPLTECRALERISPFSPLRSSPHG